jgi:hypothetical protein
MWITVAQSATLVHPIFVTTTEATKRFHSAKVADVAIDPEMVFGYGLADAVEMLNAAISCTWVGPHFTVVSASFTLCAEFVGHKILVSGPAPRR